MNNLTRCSCKVTIILVKFSKNTQISNSIKICPVGSELFREDGQMELIFAFDNSVNAPNKTEGLRFINATNTGTLIHRKSVSARTSKDSCNVEDSDKIKHCSEHYYFNSLHSSMPLPFLCVF